MNLSQRLAVAGAAVVGCTSGAQAQSPACFSGSIRPQCSGFILFEGSAVISRGGGEHTSTTVVPIPPGNGGPITLVNHFHDLPSFYSGALGYVRVVGTRSAIGAVAELGFSNTSDLGNAHRVALTARARRQFTNLALDVGAGPVGVQVFEARNGSCCTDRTIAYGATAETAVMYRGYLGLTAGADFINGAGRSSGAVHAGVRVGSYGAIAAAIATAAIGAVGFWGLSHSD
ncbi:MAG TPA: hypothetical protein VK636_19605 [Gemmatimonadaceae bacterium]|nr:hypothetical protein [Gemmatimonadaceae bacterium]